MAFPHPQVLHRPLIAHDERYGHRYLPSVNVRVPHERGCYFVRTNAQGFRSDRDFGASRDGRTRILVFGDSFASGDGVANRERFSDLLAERHGLDVQNYSVSGFGADQHLLLLEDVGAACDPDLILLCVAAHTIQRVQQASRITTDRFGRRLRVARPHFVLEGESLVLRGVPVPRASEEQRVAAIDEAESARLDSPLRVLVGDVCALMIGDATRRLLSDGRRQASAMVRRSAQRMGLREVDPDYATPATNGWRLLSRILLRFHEAARGVPVVILPLPTPEYSIDRLEPRFQRRFDELRDPERGLHVLDLTTPLAGRPYSRRRGYTFERDGHLTPTAHAEIAAVLSAELTKLGFIDAANDPPVRPLETPRGSNAVLKVGWEPGDAYVRVEQHGRMLSEGRERAFFDGAPCPGTLPFAAIAHCLEHAALDGPELAGIELVSPERLEDLLARIPERSGADGREWTSPWIERLAPWVRWLGAAERDVRRLLHFRGTVQVRSESDMEQEDEFRSVHEHRDAEGTWLAGELARLLLHHRRAAVRLRAIHALAHRWERATRRMRHEVLP